MHIRFEENILLIKQDTDSIKLVIGQDKVDYIKETGN